MQRLRELDHLLGINEYSKHNSMYNLVPTMPSTFSKAQFPFLCHLPMRNNCSVSRLRYIENTMDPLQFYVLEFFHSKQTKNRVKRLCYSPVITLIQAMVTTKSRNAIDVISWFDIISILLLMLQCTISYMQSWSRSYPSTRFPTPVMCIESSISSNSTSRYGVFPSHQQSF